MESSMERNKKSKENDVLWWVIEMKKRKCIFSNPLLPIQKSKLATDKHQTSNIKHQTKKKVVLPFSPLKNYLLFGFTFKIHLFQTITELNLLCWIEPFAWQFKTRNWGIWISIRKWKTQLHNLIVLFDWNWNLIKPKNLI